MVAATRVAVRVAVAGSVLHAVGDQGVPIREVAEIFAARLGVPAVSVTAGQAGDYVAFLGRFWGADGPASAQITRDLLGWQPTRAGLIADLSEGHYFA
jgi:nucleoside-diphosphate-sugar epimerase